MSNQAKLLPCPFCSAHAKQGLHSGAPVIWCQGENCEAMMGGEEYSGTEEQLVASWNARPISQASTALLTDAQLDALGDYIYAELGSPSDWCGFDYAGARACIEKANPPIKCCQCGACPGGCVAESKP